MQRVVIIGCGGSGKSTLARRLGEITSLPVVHLDQIYWSPGNWHHLSNEEFDACLEQELSKEAGILDGNFNRTMPQRLAWCDTVIYLDYNRFVCIFSWLKRVLSNWGRSRADMGPDCGEWLDPEFFRWLWTFNKHYRSRYHSILSQTEGKQVLILQNRRQLRRFLEELERKTT